MFSFMIEFDLDSRIYWDLIDDGESSDLTRSKF